MPKVMSPDAETRLPAAAPTRSAPNSMTLTRRTFVGRAAQALFAGVAIAVLGCGDEKNPIAVSEGDVSGSISSNHGHQAVITKAQLTAGGALTVDIQGGAAHGHTVELTADDMTSIKSGARVAKASSSANSHSHTVTFN